MKRKRPKPPARMTPNRCFVLAVDCSTNSGWSVWRNGKCYGSGEVNVENLGEVRRICAWALANSTAHAIPCVLVTERAYGGSTQTVTAMGGAKTVWWATWVECGGQKSKRLQVFAATWRSKVLGRGMGSADRDTARQVEQGMARQMVGGRDVGEDEAPAICIGRWATYAGEVWQLLPKSFRGEA